MAGLFGKYFNCVLVVFSLAGLNLALGTHNAYWVPESHVVKLPEFKGRVFPSQKAQGLPQVKIVQDDFEVVSSWDESAIMTYELLHGHVVALHAHVADPKTPGAHLYSTRTHRVPDSWSLIHHVDFVEHEGGQLKLIPKVSFWMIFLVNIALIFALVFFIYIHPFPASTTESALSQEVK